VCGYAEEKKAEQFKNCKFEWECLENISDGVNIFTKDFLSFQKKFVTLKLKGNSPLIFCPYPDNSLQLFQVQYSSKYKITNFSISMAIPSLNSSKAHTYQLFSFNVFLSSQFHTAQP
jgi:hypothetical protein